MVKKVAKRSETFANFGALTLFIACFTAVIITLVCGHDTGASPNLPRISIAAQNNPEKWIFGPLMTIGAVFVAIHSFLSLRLLKKVGRINVVIASISWFLGGVLTPIGCFLDGWFNIKHHPHVHHPAVGTLFASCAISSLIEIYIRWKSKSFYSMRSLWIKTIVSLGMTVSIILVPNEKYMVNNDVASIGQYVAVVLMCIEYYIRGRMDSRISVLELQETLLPH
eukprot:TRINITY_DN6603_c0_g1_i1.p1 TRINITY_DN6603_c0_g1~~TRINITY_DN6603_c0_g1_i1.p1  ORF type:complete len:224 (+),score=28.71 TRINITY_DN6603_c0_g1_i1:108-779(+)